MAFFFTAAPRQHTVLRNKMHGDKSWGVGGGGFNEFCELIKKKKKKITALGLELFKVLKSVKTQKQAIKKPF